ncbi:3-hydroxyisobutyryl-CoA hydrolase [Lysinibacter cavernae]|uniref:3-hydroxyisobutyryl-CoA hydrolase n=1 Tax=Lysinibacter cavernae TaxID=1640652 RepID=A0A7X5QYW7_9MICO|nr:3-hydroxyisobutyryl-CoA hydrolase [Lysinibacter cavernae]NIH52337.1 enoyl-CoA hydratase [Lysinibacter cavernae]
MTEPVAAHDDVETWREGRFLRVRLARPHALNALTPGMLWRLREAIDSVHPLGLAGILLDGAGERGLCAGGDIKLIASMSQDAATEFWRLEYAVNLAISRVDFPFVALMDGIVMGGGVGVSAHGNLRVVTERSRVAMPEVAIGLAPDVGGLFLCANAPGRLGDHLALTGHVMSGADAVYCGFADAWVPSKHLRTLSTALTHEHSDPRALVERYAERVPSDLAEQRGWIDECYSAATLSEVVVLLEDYPDARANEAARIIRAASPSAVAVTFEALARARRASGLAEVLQQDLRVSSAMLRRNDLREGIRAKVIDKDQNPRWVPARFEDVTEAEIADILAGH